MTKIPGDHIWNLIHSSPCRNPCRLFIHKDFFGPLGLHLRMCGVNLDGLRPFDQWELLDCNGDGPSVLCVMWPLVCSEENLIGNLRTRVWEQSPSSQEHGNGFREFEGSGYGCGYGGLHHLREILEQIFRDRNHGVDHLTWGEIFRSQAACRAPLQKRRDWKKHWSIKGLKHWRKDFCVAVSHIFAQVFQGRNHGVDHCRWGESFS